MFDVCVVMATYNRVDLLRKAVAALFRQRDVSFEIVVADDGSTDGTPEFLQTLSQGSEVPFRVVSMAANGGPAAARNAAWRLARAPFVAFTDDDCEADPGWLRALLDASADSGSHIVQGRTIVNPDDPVTSPWNRAVHCETFSHRYETCNLLVHLSVLERLGGFDESYPLAAGEDSDLGWRAREQGFEASFADAGLVLHARRELTMREYLRERRKWAETVRFFKRHPDARRLLYRGLFFRRRHLPVLLGMSLGLLMGVFLAWWWPLALYVAYALYLGWRVKFAGHPWTIRWKFAAMLPFAETWEILHLIRHSVRHRTLVL